MLLSNASELKKYTDDYKTILKSLSSYSRIISGKNVPVIYKGTESYTNGKNIVVAYPNLSEENHIEVTTGLVMHEASHVLLTTFSSLERYLNKIKTHNDKALIKYISNIIEDRRIDNYVINQWPGYKGYYELLYKKYFFTPENTDRLSKKVDNPQLDDFFFYMLMLVHRDMDYKNTFPQFGVVAKLIDIDNINRLKSTNEVLKLSSLILEYIKKIIKSNQENIQTTSPKTNNKEQREGEKEQSSKSIPSQQNSPLEREEERDSTEEIEQNENDNQSKKEESEEDSDDDFDYEDLSNYESINIDDVDFSRDEMIEVENLVEDHDFTNKIQKDNLVHSDLTRLNTEFNKTNNPYLSMIKFDYYGSSSQTQPDEPHKYSERGFVFDVTKLDKKQIIKNWRAVIRTTKVPFLTDNNLEEFYLEQINQGLKIGSRMARIISIKNQEKLQEFHQQKSGKINQRDLYRIPTGDFHVFKKQHTTSADKNTLVLSLDMSYSMTRLYRTQMKNISAIAKAAEINNTRLIVNLKYGCQKYLVVKLYDSKVNKAKDIEKMAYFTPQGLTPEFKIWGLIKTTIPQEDNVHLVNMTDGEPTDGKSSMMTLRKNIKEIKSLKTINVFINNEYDNFDVLPYDTQQMINDNYKGMKTFVVNTNTKPMGFANVIRDLIEKK